MAYTGYYVNDKGSRCWVVEGKFHREGGPALVTADGDKFWYKHDIWHRTDGPAVNYSTGTKKWYVNGELHRIDGPAIIWNDGSLSWFVNDEEMHSNEDFQAQAKLSDEDMAIMILTYGDVGSMVRYS